MQKTAMNAAEAKEKLDQTCKVLLSDKRLLARILKETVPEVASYTPAEIQSLIEGEPDVGTRPVHQDEKISGKSNESSSIGEGFITYDVIFDLFLTTEEEPVKIVINLEAQNAYDPGYPIITRGVYYCARLLSSQKNREFFHSEYGKLCKVYSIWICFDAKEQEDTLTEFHIAKQNLYRKAVFSREAYDKLSVVLACLPKKLESANPLLGMLRIIFAQELTVDEKIKRMAEDYDFIIENNREVDEMCNYSDYIENIGIEKGKAAGIAEGKAAGIAEGLRSLVETLKDLIPDFEALYQRVIKNEIYADVTREEVRRYLLQ